MFLVEATNISNPENSKKCNIQINRNGIKFFYEDETIEIPKNRFKNVVSMPSPKTKRKRRGQYEEIVDDENKLFINCDIGDTFHNLTFTTIDNCDNIIYWLRENIRSDSL